MVSGAVGTVDYMGSWCAQGKNLATHPGLMLIYQESKNSFPKVIGVFYGPTIH